MNKICTKCGNSRTLDMFYAHGNGKMGKQSICKPCQKKKDLEYSRTIRGLVTSMYKHQRYTSKKHGRPMPEYNLNELNEWVVSQPNFGKLYSEWIKSGYDRLRIPSCDRINNGMWYSLSNIRLVTAHENIKNSAQDGKIGLIQNGFKRTPVVGRNIKTGEENLFLSIGVAVRQTGASQSQISMCCSGSIHNGFKCKSSGGYEWRYAY